MTATAAVNKLVRLDRPRPALGDATGDGAGRQDTVLAYFYAWARVLRIVDGPDAVHRRIPAFMETKKTPPYVG